MISLLKLMFPFVRPYWKFALFSILLSLPLAAIKAYQAYFIKEVIDTIFLPNTTQQDAMRIAGIIIGLAIINYPIRFWHFYGMRMVVDIATCDIRRAIYLKFQKLSSGYFAKTKQGRLLSIMTNDTTIFANAFMHGTDVIREPLFALAYVGVAFYHDWKLALVIFMLLPFFMIIFNVTGKRIRKYVTKAQEETGAMTHHAAEGLTGQKVIKAFNLQEYMRHRFSEAQDNFISHKRKSNSAEEHSHPLVELVGASAFATVIFVAFLRFKDGALTVGEFISFISALALFMDPVRRFSKANTKLNQARAAASRIFDLLDEKEEIDNGKLELKEFKDSIEFCDVTFSYGERPVLQSFSLKINKGQKVALVGLSGSGKSTLISLLLRLYDIDSGKILVDGMDIKEYTLDSLREQFALVSQDIFLFNDSVKENLVAGVEVSDQQIEKALEVSFSKEFVEQLPDGVGTMIGDRGLKLSGGQSQRLTIARAFLNDCPVYLFDEATSALDNESEKVVQEALDNIGQQKTVVAIAHRLSSIQNYDNIVVLKEGHKIEEGNHLQLMDQKGEYYKLYQMTQMEN